MYTTSSTHTQAMSLTSIWSKLSTLPTHLHLQSLTSAVQLQAITSRLLTIPCPTPQSITPLAQTLKQHFADHYLILNLSEKTYDTSLLGDAVLEHSFPGYPAPPLSQLFAILQSIHSWLAAHEKNVIVMHCASGQGRTVVVAAAYLTYTKLTPTMDDALRHVSQQLHKPLHELLIPTQLRYCQYIDELLKGQIPRKQCLVIERVILHTIPRFELLPPVAPSAAAAGSTASANATSNVAASSKVGAQCRPYIQIFKEATTRYHKPRASMKS